MHINCSILRKKFRARSPVNPETRPSCWPRPRTELQSNANSIENSFGLVDRNRAVNNTKKIDGNLRICRKFLLYDCFREKNEENVYRVTMAIIL